MQEFAYRLATEAVMQPEMYGHIQIDMVGYDIKGITTALFDVKFYASHASLSKKKDVKCKQSQYKGDGEWIEVDGVSNVSKWYFDVEEKEYQNSPHRTKISFSSYDMINYDRKEERWITNKKKMAKVQEDVQKFINQLMKDVKAEPRFSLAELHINR